MNSINQSYYNKNQSLFLLLLGVILILNSAFTFAQPLSRTEQLIESYADILVNKPEQNQENLLKGLIEQAEQGHPNE